MKLLDSLLDAIVRLEGDALVMHVGEKPYVVTASSSMNAYRGPLAWGQVELSSRVLTLDAVSSMLAQILPPDQQEALNELGAIEHEIPGPNGPDQRFTVIAARGGEDVWVEVRRKIIELPVPEPVVEPVEPAAEPVQAAVETAAPEVTATQQVQEDVVAIEEPAPVAQVAEPIEQQVAEPVVAEAAVAEVAAAKVAEVPVEEVLATDVPAPAVTAPEAPAVEASLAEASLEADVVDISLEEEIPLGEIPLELVSAIDSEDALDTIVMALPGDAAEAVALDSVPDNAFQLIDEEPQGLPTEAEVDAMLAATASALLSDLAAESITDDAIVGDVEVVDARAEEDEAPVVHVSMLNVIAAREAGEPFELSPPTAVGLLEPEIEVEETVTYVAVGTPLFSDEAIRAAEAPASGSVADAPPIVPEFTTIIPVPDGPFEPAIDRRVEAPTEPPLPPAFDDRQDSPAAVSEEDLEKQVAVWASALRELSNPSIAVPPAEVAQTPAPEAPSQPAVSQPIDLETTMEASVQDVQPAQTVQKTPEVPRIAVEPRVPAYTEPPAPEPGPIVTTVTPTEGAALVRTLRLAAARGAETVYVVAQSKPMVRIDGEITPLESEATLTAADVERLVLELAPPRRREALQAGPVEWLCDVPEIGRVRCLTFKDHRGPGVLFRMFPARAISADQLGLTPEVQALGQQSDGLVLVTGARTSGKSTLLNAFVDSINRTRSEHVITIESQIGFVHESRRSFISQRETRGDADLGGAIARSALREDPDVIMIDDLRSAESVMSALEAAESGRLVFASVSAISAAGAIDRLLEMLPVDARPKARGTLANVLRGVIAQVLLRRTTGGRAPAREVLLNTPAVSALLLEGKSFELPAAIENGRRLGMVPLTDSLAAHVRSGTVNVEEAYRKALDRAALVTQLKRDGIDTAFAERLA